MLDRVWHYNDNQGVYSAPRIHANGHIRPKAVTFRTRLAAAGAWCESVKDRIDVCTRIMHSARKDHIRARAKLQRDALRLIERRAKALLKEIINEQS